MEEFKIIEGHEDYEISEKGIVRNVKTKVTRNQRIDQDNFLTVDLYSNKKSNTKRVHTLIAKSFIENPLNKNCVMHIDRNKRNNKLSNLIWWNSLEIDEFRKSVQLK